MDRQIVHCLLADGRASFDRIGSVVGVSAQTAARRYRALADAGALRLTARPDSRVTNSQTWFARMICRPGTADRVGDALVGRPEASWVTTTAGGAEVICAIESVQDPMHGTMLLDRLPQIPQVLRFGAFVVLHRFDTPRADWWAIGDPLDEAQRRELTARTDSHVADRAGVALTAEDATLLDRLAADGRATISSLADATGWSPARTSRRVHELLASQAVRIEVELSPRAFGFTTSAFLWLEVLPTRLDAVGKALSEHPESGFAAAITGRSNLLAAVTCRSGDALYRYLTARIGALPGIRGVEVSPLLRRLKSGDPRAGRLLRHPAD